jgi:fructose-specific phosphotransferase system IIC component
MRYLVAIIFAIVGAALAMQFLSGPVANWTALQFKFESSDEAENLNQLAFMGVNLFGLIVGWTIGWAIGGPLSKGQRPQ